MLLLSKLQLELGLVTATGRHSGTRANFNVVFLPGGLAHGGAAIFHSPGPVQGGLGQEPDLPRREGPLPVGCAWPHALLRRVLVDYSVRDLPVRPRKKTLVTRGRCMLNLPAVGWLIRMHPTRSLQPTSALAQPSSAGPPSPIHSRTSCTIWNTHAPALLTLSSVMRRSRSATAARRAGPAAFESASETSSTVGASAGYSDGKRTRSVSRRPSPAMAGIARCSMASDGWVRGAACQGKIRTTLGVLSVLLAATGDTSTERRCVEFEGERRTRLAGSGRRRSFDAQLVGIDRCQHLNLHTPTTDWPPCECERNVKARTSSRCAAALSSELQMGVAPS